MIVEGLTPEQQQELDACKTPEEMLAFAKEIGYELSEEELDLVSGGLYDENYKQQYCPKCNVKVYWQKSPKRGMRCPRCNMVYSENDSRLIWK